MSTTATTAPKPKPTDAQVALVVSAIDVFPQADFVAWMDESSDGTMMLSQTEDGLEQIARFGTDGWIIGDWH